MTCVLPLFLTILSSDPCAVLREVETGWHKAEWFRSIYSQLDGRSYQPKALNDLDRPLIVEELPAPIPCGPTCEVGARTVVERDAYRIRFYGPYMAPLDGWTHELRHVGCFAFEAAFEWCPEVGHGTERDAWCQAIQTLVNWGYPFPLNHPYRPDFGGCRNE